MKINRQTIVAFIIGAILFSGIGVGAATLYQFALSTDSLYINGKILDKPLYNYQSTNYLPLRAVAESLGADVSYKNKRIDITQEKWDAEKLQEFLDIVYSVIYIRAYQSKQMSDGSGFAVGDGSYIVTNLHVIGDATVIKGKNHLEDDFTEFEVVARNAKQDIAILRTKDRKYPPLKLGDSDVVKKGDGVLAFSHPDGTPHTLTAYGKVASAGNRIDSTVETLPGSSGGALVDEKGKVIGVIKGKYVFGGTLSVPINIVKDMIKELN